jgi:hypothetical protein
MPLNQNDRSPIHTQVKKLGRTHKWLLSLASRSSEMHEQLKHDISAIEHEIRVGLSSIVIIIWRLNPTNGSVMSP